MWLVIAIVFVSGAVVGFVGSGYYYRTMVGGILHKGPAAARNYIMKRLTVELNLTKDQQEVLSDILEETQFQMQELRAEYHPKMEAIIDNGVATFKSRLAPEQQKKLDDLYAKVKMRWRLKKKMKEGMNK